MITALHFVDKLCNEQQILGLKKDIFNVLAISAAAKAGDVETTRHLLAERSAAQVESPDFVQILPNLSTESLNLVTPAQGTFPEMKYFTARMYS